MDCNEFQKSIQDFIDNKLSMLKKEEFIKHLSKCEECNDDLETYYIIINCIKELDLEIDTVDNYHGNYQDFIKDTIKDIKRYKLKRKKHRIAFPSIVGVIVLLTGVSFKAEEGEKVKEVTKSTIFTDFVDNDLSMRFRFSESHVLSEPSFSIEELIEKKERKKHNEQ